MMLVTLWAAAALAAAVPAAPSEIDRAIAMGRFDQARLMIAAKVKAGATGEAIERPLAALAFATGGNEEALARLEVLLRAAPDDALLLEQATIAALRSGKTGSAALYAERATRYPAASWRVWNAKGVLADRARDWADADRAYARAAALAPDQAEIVNNLGWSRLLRGDWPGAAEALARAAAMKPGAGRIANNLDLAQLGLAGDLPAQRDGEATADYAARLNDAGIAARLRGDPRRARAAFAQAITASGNWYARASANLAQVEANK
jgi:Flp pilus assembly protein TadD